MAKLEFENQPYYAVRVGESEVFDTRYRNGQVVVPDNQQAYGFTSEQLILPMSLPRGKGHEPPYRIGNKNYVNGLTVLRSTGRDGEDVSGGIELLEVIVPGKKVIAAIRSYLGRHDNDMPVPGTSWACEFEDVAMATEFWDRHWRPSFRKVDLDDAVEKFKTNQSLGSKDAESIRSYELGLLRPWFQQRTTDAAVAKDFASDGSYVIRQRVRDVTAEEYTPGNVYKIPETELFSTKVTGHRIATCLAALRQQTGRGLWSSPREEIVIQWDDGCLTNFTSDREPELLPTPLTAREVRSANR